MRKKIIISILIIIIGGGCFYGGMKYSSAKVKNSASLSAPTRNFQDFQNMNQEERQQRIQDMGGIRRAGSGQQAVSGSISGEIISKDEKSITVKLRDYRQGESQNESGGSKIIFFSDSAKISKLAEGSAEDLQIGKNISVFGQANSDGSVIAESIQLR